MLRLKGKLVYESWKFMRNRILVAGRGGSNISYNEADESEAVPVKRPGGRTEIRSRRLALVTECDGSGGTCPQDWQWYSCDEEERWPGFEGGSGCLY